MRGDRSSGRLWQSASGNALSTTVDDVTQALGDLDYQPLTSSLGGQMLYEFVLRSGVEHVLELGCAHGTSTAYMAAALHERGEGSILTIDRAKAMTCRPNVLDVTRRLGFEEHVHPIFAERSYTWELMHLLERQLDQSRGPAFDFCFIDGAHTWETDGLAFLLVDKLLRPDSWVLFDDLTWTQDRSPSLSGEKARSIPEEERRTAQVGKIFDLLVRDHPAYTEFRVMGTYGWAYKATDGTALHQGDVDTSIDEQLLRKLVFSPFELSSPTGAAHDHAGHVQV